MELRGKEWYSHSIEITEVSSMNISLMTTNMAFPLVRSFKRGEALN